MVESVVSHGPEINGFKLVRQLGPPGGFGVTFLYEDLERRHASQVAVKVPLDKDRETALITGDIMSLAALADVPEVAHLLEVKLVGDRYVLFMEYVEGEMLRTVMSKSPVLPVEQALDYAARIADGLAQAHQRKLVHRDIKPENIIIEEATNAPKILDFGISSLMGERGCFHTMLGRHTPYYTPPEVLVHGRGDHRVDIFALGVTLYEMLTGVRPFYQRRATEYQIIKLMQVSRPTSPRQINPEIPLRVERALLKAIQPEAEQRFATMDDFRRALAPPAEIRLARQYLAARAYARAERLLRSLLDREPEEAQALDLLATTLNSCQRGREAAAVLDRLLDLDPGRHETHLKLGMTLASLGQIGQAQGHLRRAEELCPDQRKKKIIRLARTRVEGTGR